MYSNAKSLKAACQSSDMKSYASSLETYASAIGSAGTTMGNIIDVGSSRKACNFSITAISTPIALLFGQYDVHCLSSWHDEPYRS